MDAPRALRLAGVLAVAPAILLLTLATRRSRREVQTMESETVGCALVRKDGTCEIGEKGATLRVRVPGSSPAVVVEVGGHRVSASVSRDGSSSLVRVDVPPGAPDVRVISADREARIALTTVPRAWLDEARSLRRAGKLEEAETIARAHLSSSDAAESALAQALVARLALSRGEIDRAIELLGKSYEASVSAGLSSSACEDTTALAFTLARSRGRYDAAHAALDRGADSCGATPAGLVDEAYYRGVVALETGDARAALASFRRAGDRAKALGIDTSARHAENALALTLMQLGRRTEGLFIAENLAKRGDPSPCDGADVVNNVALGIVLANEAGDVDAPDPAEGLLEARDAVALARSCPRAAVRSAAMTTWAQAALAAHEIDEARVALGEARRATPDAHGLSRPLWLDIEGRASLGSGDAAGALVLFERERDLAMASLSSMQAWRAETGRAEALLALGRLADAESALRSAESLAARGGARVPLGEGRTSFLADRERSARLLIDVLLRRRDEKGAFAAARRAIERADAAATDIERVGALGAEARTSWERAAGAYVRERAALDEAASHDWEIPADDLPRRVADRETKARGLRDALDTALAALGFDPAPSAAASPEPGDVQLLAFPGMTGWLVFDADRTETHVARLDLPRNASADDVGNAIFSVVAPRLALARRIRIFTHGRLATFDWHAARFRDQPLVAFAPVVYASAGRARPAGSADTTLVVADPTSDLPAARREGREIALGAGASVTMLEGEDATGPRVREELARARHAHFAAHAWFAGRDGWESAMALAGGGSLGVADVLALGHAPDTVVLSTCEAARRTAGIDAAGLSLAQSFALAGSRRVVAPTRPVDDEMTARLMRLLYASLREEPALGVEGALRRAQLTLRAERPDADWSAFRALGF